MINMRFGSFPEINEAAAAFYQRHGVVHVPGIIPADEVGRFRESAMGLSRRLANPEAAKTAYGRVFQQMVNVWTRDEVMKELTLHRRLSSAAEKLAGVPLRLWHDQILIKHPHNQAATEFHQDQPYWPHDNSPQPITAWVALVDVPVERGCMTFIPGSHRWTDLPAQDLTNPKSLFEICPELAWEPRWTIPLRAGDCTFHHGRLAHMATPNLTDDPRVAHAVIFMDAGAVYTGKRHPVTDSLGLEAGRALEHELFPRLGSGAAVAEAAGVG
jgi:phytanoyl-CoA hydroxylase